MLYAWEEHPEMGALLARSFELEGDLEIVRHLPLYLPSLLTIIICRPVITSEGRLVSNELVTWQDST
jgi:hypothetical protein